MILDVLKIFLAFSIIHIEKTKRVTLGRILGQISRKKIEAIQKLISEKNICIYHATVFTKFDNMSVTNTIRVFI